MQTLTDSYTISQPATGSVTQEERRWIYQLFIPDYASTTLTWDMHIGINERIRSLLQKFENLADGWDGEESPAPAKSALIKAKYLTQILTKGGQRIFHAAPGPNQEIMLDLRNSSNGRSLEIIFYPARAVFVKFPAAGSPVQGAFDFAGLTDLLKWLNTK